MNKQLLAELIAAGLTYAQAAPLSVIGRFKNAADALRGFTAVTRVWQMDGTERLMGHEFPRAKSHLRRYYKKMVQRSGYPVMVEHGFTKSVFTKKF